MVSSRIRISSVIYVFGLLLTPMAIGLSAALEALGKPARPGPGVTWLLLASFLVCTGGVLAMKKPVGRKVVLILIPAIVIPLEVLLIGALLIGVLGLRGIQ
jgi:hypothetical protein